MLGAQTSVFYLKDRCRCFDRQCVACFVVVPVLVWYGKETFIMCRKLKEKSLGPI